MTPRRRDFAYYLPEERRDEVIGAQQRFGAPRPGFGTIYVSMAAGRENTAWEAVWVDEYPQPNEAGEVCGHATYEGSRQNVLAWARLQPAARRLIPVEEEPYWVPLTDDDDDARLVDHEARVAAARSRRRGWQA